MDRDGNWDIINKTVLAMVFGIGNTAVSATQLISRNYKLDISDQFTIPTVMTNDRGPIGKILDNDSLIFYNYRPDRARELTLALLGMHQISSKFISPHNLFFSAFTSYFLPAAIESKIKIAFPDDKIENTLGKIVSDAGMRQFRIAESEKYPHITYFFNCGFEDPLPGEERAIVKSADVKSFDLKPQMEATEITKRLMVAIKSKKYDLILVNYANVDAVGHSGDLAATTEAIGVVDNEMKKLSDVVLSVDGTLIITADHGNAEQMIQTSGGSDRETFHSLSPVPFILVRSDLKGKNKHMIASSDILSSMISSKRSLADIAPTILQLFGIEKPISMEGQSLLPEIIIE